MARKLTPRVIRSGPYWPTQPRTGDSTGYILRKKGLMTRGRGDLLYEECVPSLGDIPDGAEQFEQVALTGTLALTENSRTVVGTGTIFTSESGLGQRIVAIPDDNSASWPIVPQRIISDTEMEVWEAPDTTVSGLTGWQIQRIFEVGNERGTCLRGNFVRLDKGSILSAGTGEARLNGSSLSGESLMMTLQPQLSLYDTPTGDYDSFPLGMATPTGITAAGVAGGTKGMQAGTYTLVFQSARKETGGYNLPSLPVEVTITAGQKIRITFTAMDTAHGSNAWRVSVTQFQQSLGATKANLNGPWFFYQPPGMPPNITVTDAEVSPSGGTYDIEWLDAEVTSNDKVDFTVPDDPPVEANYVAILNSIPVWISCQGTGRVIAVASATNANPVVFTTTDPNGLVSGQKVTISGATGGWTGVNGLFVATVISATTFSIPVNSTAFGALSGTVIAVVGATAPGPFIVPAKPTNVEAAPLVLAFSSSPPETILGVVSAQGRLYLLTQNHLQIAQATPDEAVPILIRPYWKDGFANENQLLFLDGVLYGYTLSGPSRSAGDGDLQEAQRDWAAPVYEITKHWNPGHVIDGYDPTTDLVLFFHFCDRLNASGFWTTRVLGYSVSQQMWAFDDEYSSEVQDMIVAGAATIGDNLELTLGGRITV